MYRFKFGDRVKNSCYGEGTVVEQDAEQYNLIWVHYDKPEYNNTIASSTGTGYDCTAEFHTDLELLVHGESE